MIRITKKDSVEIIKFKVFHNDTEIKYSEDKYLKQFDIGKNTITGSFHDHSTHICEKEGNNEVIRIHSLFFDLNVTDETKKFIFVNDKNEKLTYLEFIENYKKILTQMNDLRENEKIIFDIILPTEKKCIITTCSFESSFKMVSYLFFFKKTEFTHDYNINGYVYIKN